MEPTTAGRGAFEAYNKSRKWVNHRGDPTPPWDDLPPEIREGWEAAAQAVIDFDGDGTLQRKLPHGWVRVSAPEPEVVLEWDADPDAIDSNQWHVRADDSLWVSYILRPGKHDDPEQICTVPGLAKAISERLGRAERAERERDEARMLVDAAVQDVSASSERAGAAEALAQERLEMWAARQQGSRRMRTQRQRAEKAEARAEKAERERDEAVALVRDEW